jgi:hypothetical protein
MITSFASPFYLIRNEDGRGGAERGNNLSTDKASKTMVRVKSANKKLFPRRNTDGFMALKASI